MHIDKKLGSLRQRNDVTTKKTLSTHEEEHEVGNIQQKSKHLVKLAFQLNNIWKKIKRCENSL